VTGPGLAPRHAASRDAGLSPGTARHRASRPLRAAAPAFDRCSRSCGLMRCGPGSSASHKGRSCPAGWPSWRLVSVIGPGPLLRQAAPDDSDPGSPGLPVTRSVDSESGPLRRLSSVTCSGPPLRHAASRNAGLRRGDHLSLN
jgi:hypothetical protein